MNILIKISQGVSMLYYTDFHFKFLNLKLIFGLTAAILLSSGAFAQSTVADDSAWAAVQPAGWWNKTVFYEIYVRSFQDSNGDRVGDFEGLISRLDYLNDGKPDGNSLGVGAIYLMPIQNNRPEDPHGYRIEDYYKIDTEYGNDDSFRRFLEEAHKRGMKVIIDHVINHTSNNHPWFLSSLKDPNGPHGDWYIWADKPFADKGPWNQQVWHKATDGRYYYGVFTYIMPDLNYRNPAVTAETLKMSRYWLENFSLDGFRIDAPRHILEDNGIMMDATASFDWFRNIFFPYIKSAKPDVYVVGEAFAYPDRPEYQIAGQGVDMSFDDRFRNGVLGDYRARKTGMLKSGDATLLLADLRTILSQYPQNQFGINLGNHDEVRAMTKVEEQFQDPAEALRAMKTAAALLLTFPGVPYLYYGEELGLLGKGSDDNKRRPIQWDNTPKTMGFTAGPKPFGAGFNQGGLERTVVNETGNPSSLLSHYRNLIHLRNKRPSLQYGRTFLLQGNSPALVSYLRTTGEESTLVIQNVSGLALPSVTVSLPQGPFKAAPLAKRLWGTGTAIQPVMENQGGFTLTWGKMEAGETVILDFGL